MPTQISRREFVHRTPGALTTVALGGALLPAVHTSAAARDTPIRLGIIGCGGIMSFHVRGLVERNESVSFAWLCDVDDRQVAKMEGIIGDHQATAPRKTRQFEQVCDDRDVDGCIIATPHHWHAPIALQAMASGKDVYIEKPISHVYAEGPAIREAARKYQRVVQQGSQMRNSPVTMQAAEILSSGMIGDIRAARAWTAELRSVVPPVPDSDVPAGVDYDRWLGPAPARRFNRHRFHQSWRMYRDYGNGEIGDDGIHDLDMAAWGLGIDGLPKQVTARGSRVMLKGNAGDYPDNLHVTYEYPDGRLLVYENYPFMAYGLHGFDNGNVFYGSEGYMIFSRRGAFQVFLGPKNKPGPTEEKAIRGERGYAEHMTEFLQAIRTRERTSASPEVAHYSCALVHLGEIAFRTAGRLDFDPTAEQFVGGPNGTNDADIIDRANRMLTKDYRAPYTLPG